MSRDIKEILNSDDEILKRTDISQPALTVVSLAAALYLQNRQVVPLACAGFSLGEFPALAISGVITLEDAIRLTAERGKIMQAACDSLLEKSSVPPGMMAVLGLSPEQIDLVLAGFSDADLYAANYNSPKQTVISGTANALSLAEEEFKKAGAKRVIRLKVSGPFHSPLMQDAANKFSQVLDGFNGRSRPAAFFQCYRRKSRFGDRGKEECCAAHLQPCPLDNRGSGNCFPDG